MTTGSAAAAALAPRGMLGLPFYALCRGRSHANALVCYTASHLGRRARQRLALHRKGCPCRDCVGETRQLPSRCCVAPFRVAGSPRSSEAVGGSPGRHRRDGAPPRMPPPPLYKSHEDEEGRLETDELDLPGTVLLQRHTGGPRGKNGRPAST